MAITQAELDDFHTFASQRIGREDAGVDLDDLVIEWDSVRNRQDINEAIREGLDDIEAGRTRPAEEVNAALQAKYNLEG